MRALIKCSLTLCVLLAMVLTARGGVDSVAADLRAKEAALTARQRVMRDSIGSIVRQQMVNTANSSRTQGDTEGNSRLRVSLLTCGPGSEIYEYYGHSAIRVQRMDSSALDVVFNYGVFDFNSGNFALRFALGHTDYVCAEQKTAEFVEHYRRKRIYIDEQVLNVSQREAQRLYDALVENCRPENCVYRYNFFFDNCATRVRDKIEDCLDGKLRYPERPTERSLRDAVHFYSHNYRWATFGQDLLLGSEADIPATGRELQFAPLIMEQDFAQTLIIDQSGMVRLFAAEKQRLLEGRYDPSVSASGTSLSSELLSPLAVMVYLLLLVLVLGIWEWHKGRIVWIVDSALLIMQGLGGIIVAFLYFFSTHPTVGSNVLVWVLNPLPLLGLYWQIKGGRTQCYWYYHAVALVVLAIFLVALPQSTQYVSPATKVMLITLLLRNIINVAVFIKNKRRN